MKKRILAWLMMLAVLLSFTGCGSEQDDNFAGGDTEIHEAEKQPADVPVTEPDDSGIQDPTQTDTPAPETQDPSAEGEKKEDEQTPSGEEQTPSDEEEKGEEQKPSDEQQKPSAEEKPSADELPGAAVAFYGTYQKVHQLQIPDGLESIALTYARNSRAFIRITGMEDLQSFEGVADPYFQFSDAVEQGEQDDAISDELLGDDAPAAGDEDDAEDEEVAIGFMEGLTGNVYSDSFFRQNTILMIYNVASGKTNSGIVTAVRKDGNTMLIYLDVTPQASQTNDNVYRFITLEFKKADIAECEIFKIIEVDNSKK